LRWRAPYWLAPDCADLRNLAPAGSGMLNVTRPQSSGYALCAGLSVCDQKRQVLCGTGRL